jgi:hypothetical protein
MLKSAFLAALVFALPLAASAKPIVSKLDASTITKGLPLEGRVQTKSGDGRTKQVWQIKGVANARFETIGKNQSDADNVGWNCAEYDKAGSLVRPTSSQSFCHQLFARVLGSVVDNPAELAKQLTAQAATGRNAVQRFGDIAIETDGEYFFVRRVSRI